MRKPGAVIFDCDGVIVDSEPATEALLAEDLAAHGLKVGPEDFGTLFLGGTMDGVAETARAKGADLPEDWVARFYEKLYARLGEGTPLVEGVLDLFDALEAAGVPFAVGSNGTRRKMEVTLGQHGLTERLEGRIFSRQDVARPKPAPDLYLHAAGALGVPPRHCVVIEDSPTGARAARAAGMACLGLARETPAARLAEAGARPVAGHVEVRAALAI